MPKASKFGYVKIDTVSLGNAREAYFQWKDLNTYISSVCTRGLNMPDAISEPLGCFCLDLEWNRGAKGGDARDPISEKIYEFKATSRFDSDLSSFGPKTHFDDLVFLRFNLKKNLLYVYDLQINSEDIGKYPANKHQTIQQQRNEKRRPRVSLKKLFVDAKKLEPDVIFDILNEKIIVDNRKGKAK